MDVADLRHEFHVTYPRESEVIRVTKIIRVRAMIKCVISLFDEFNRAHGDRTASVKLQAVESHFRIDGRVIRSRDVAVYDTFAVTIGKARPRCDAGAHGKRYWDRCEREHAARECMGARFRKR
jgi:hypothetical protein